MDAQDTPPFKFNNSLASVGFIILLVGAVIGFQLGRWSTRQVISPPMFPTRSIPTGQKDCPQDARLCPDGSSVGRVGPNCEFAPCPTAKPFPTGSTVVNNDCVKAGCSGELCVEPSQADIVTTCEFKEEYACFSYSRCERQPDGSCGWTQTPEYSQCLNDLKSRR